MPDREEIINGLKLCANGTPCIGEKYVSCPFSPRNNPEQNCGVMMARNALALLKEQPEIVRCRDCKRGEKLPMLQHYPNLTWCNKHSTAHNDDWFCADGERRTDDV